MVTINIEKRDLWILSAILVFIVGIGIVIAYQSGGPPSVIGHSMEELELPSIEVITKTALFPCDTSKIVNCPAGKKAISCSISKVEEGTPDVVSCHNNQDSCEFFLDKEFQVGTCVPAITYTCTCSNGVVTYS